MKAQHTPGPWKAADLGDSIWIEGPNFKDNVICDMVGREERGVLTSEDVANAHLIAAAPELLEALEELLKLYTETDFDVCGLDLPFVDKANALIAKTKGGNA